jgi:uncharacterized metal-binding protein YceD (DUF177 family)
VKKPSFVIPLSDIERGARSVDFTLDEAWLRAMLGEAGATPLGPGSASVELSMNGRQVMVRGRAEAKVTMPCVVSLDPIEIELKPEIFLMLSERQPSPGEASGRRGGPKRGGEAASKGRKPRAEDDSDTELSPEDAALDSFEGSQIELDSFFREFLLLELPLFPRRSDLPSPEGPAIAPPSAEAPSATIDPRLLPLADLKTRLSQKNKSKE